MKYALGVDVGGTNIRIAVVDENGSLHVVLPLSKTAQISLTTLISTAAARAKRFLAKRLRLQ